MRNISIILLLLITSICAVSANTNEYAVQLTINKDAVEDSLTINVFSFKSFSVDWGDGVRELKEANTDQEKVQHLYSEPGEKIVTIYGEHLKTLTVPNIQLTDIVFGKESELNLLTEVRVAHNNLESLDISNLKNLAVLDCSDNMLKNVDLSGKTLLKDLRISNNNLENLDISDNVNLTKIYATNVGVKALDFSNNSALQEIQINNNGLEALEVEHMESLEKLICAHNNLTELDLTNNAKLKNLDCTANQLSVLSLHPDITEMSDFQCAGNRLSLLTIPRIRPSEDVNNFNYTPQGAADLTALAHGYTIDLSGSLFISKDTPTPTGNGKDEKTIVLWLNENNKRYSPTPTERNGIYTIDPKDKASVKVKAQMKNMAYGGYTWETNFVELSDTTVDIDDETEENIEVENGILYSNSSSNYNLLLTDLSGKTVLTKQNCSKKVLDLKQYIQKGEMYILLVTISDSNKVFNIIVCV